MIGIRKVLIANRGEIAVRIVQAARDVGIASVAVYADPDADALHVRMADEAYALVGSSPADTYLDQGKLLHIARKSGADAIHPGYGFLSERAGFARAVQEAGLLWIGPDPETIELLGDKARARALAQSVGAPLVPGTNDPVPNAEAVLDFVDEYGLPVAIKAVHGGGGRGMRVARTREEVTEAYEAAVREAVTAFGQGDCLVERFLDKPRHIEAQVLGDRTGRVVVIGTRDCSLQRRNQKLVEEAPAPALVPELSQKLKDAAEAICRASNYVGAGTVEFLLGADGMLTFLEVNTRLQVEHSVTEVVSGVDLVQEQFRIAAGEPMQVPDEIPTFGHAIEFRINAEDPALGFLPTPGTLTVFEPPSGPGVRLDTGVTEGAVVSGSFDSLLAKLIVWGSDREQALARARRALHEFKIEGLATVLPFHRQIVNEPAFIDLHDGFGVYTRWIDQDCTADFGAAPAVPVPATPIVERMTIEIEGRQVELGLPESFLRRLGQASAAAFHPAEAAIATESTPSKPAIDLERNPNPEHAHDRKLAQEPGAVLAPFDGTLSMWKMEEGADVTEGDTVAIIEAMKMEVPVLVSVSGILEHRLEAGEHAGAQQTIGVVREK